MQTLKFVSPNQKHHLFADAVRKNVNDYFKEKGISTKGNASLIVQTVAMLSIYIVPFVLLLTVPMSMWIAIILTIVMGIGTAGIGMAVMHGAAHGSYSNKAWINNLFASTMYALGGNVFNWKVQHNILHHTYTNINEYDQDIASKGPIRLSDHAKIRKIHRYQYIHAFFFYGLMTMFKVVRDFTQMAEFNREGYARQYHTNPTAVYLKMIAVKVLYFAVIIGLPILLTPFTWWQVLIGFAIMHWTTGLILGTVFQLAHVVEGLDQPLPDKSGVIESDWAVHELHTTSDFARNNLFLNWYVGGLNFQIEHHLFPHICHIHYRKIAPIVERTAKEYGLTYNLKPTFFAALKSHVRRLKELGRPVVTAAA
ncbi:MAG TPA: acyl-CoA desaturase [Saprospiraceae bacterium]|nr:acyl-CoA desaturase [Saprospiraceae bacterium]